MGRHPPGRAREQRPGVPRFDVPLAVRPVHDHLTALPGREASRGRAGAARERTPRGGRSARTEGPRPRTPPRSRPAARRWPSRSRTRTRTAAPSGSRRARPAIPSEGLHGLRARSRATRPGSRLVPKGLQDPRSGEHRSCHHGGHRDRGTGAIHHLPSPSAGDDPLEGRLHVRVGLRSKAEGPFRRRSSNGILRLLSEQRGQALPRPVEVDLGGGWPRPSSRRPRRPEGPPGSAGRWRHAGWGQRQERSPEIGSAGGSAGPGRSGTSARVEGLRRAQRPVGWPPGEPRPPACRTGRPFATGRTGGRTPPGPRPRPPPGRPCCAVRTMAGYSLAEQPGEPRLGLDLDPARQPHLLRHHPSTAQGGRKVYGRNLGPELPELWDLDGAPHISGIVAQVYQASLA